MFEIVVTGRVVENGDVAIAMIEAGAGKERLAPHLRRRPDQADEKSSPVVSKPPSRSSR